MAWFSFGSPSFNSLVEISESLGSLPFLDSLILSHNQLGQAANWNCLTSPFIRENLRHLVLNTNGLTSFPEAILKLNTLKILNISNNYLTEVPARLGRMKCLRFLEFLLNMFIPSQLGVECHSKIFCCICVWDLLIIDINSISPFGQRVYDFLKRGGLDVGEVDLEHRRMMNLTLSPHRAEDIVENQKEQGKYADSIHNRT